MSRRRIIGWTLLGFVLLAVLSWMMFAVATYPAKCRQAYFDELVQVVPIGSTYHDFVQAAELGKLGYPSQTMGREEETYRYLINDGSIFCFIVFAVAIKDDKDRITGYDIGSGAAFFGRNCYRYEAVYK